MDMENEGQANTLCTRIYPWLLCAFSFTVQFLGLGFYKGFASVYVALQAEFKDNDALTAWTGSLSFALTYICSPVTFRCFERFGYRISMFTGALLYGLGLFTSSLVPSVPWLYLTFGGLFAVGQSLLHGGSILILEEYYSRTRWSIAHGIALAGNSLGALALSPLLEVILTKYGFNLGFKLASAASVYLMVISLFYKRPPDEAVQQRNGPRNEQKTNKQAPLPLRKNKAFIAFIVAITLMHVGYYIPFVHLMRMALDLGESRTKSALLPSYMALSQLIGKVTIGLIATSPRANKIKIYQMALLVNCLATTTCPTITSYSGMIAYVVFFGLQDGCTSANNLLVIKEIVSYRQVNEGYRVFLFTSAISFLFGPSLAGLLYDTTGTYSLAFFFSGGTAALAIFVLFLVPRYKLEQGPVDQFPDLMPSDSSSNSSGAPIDLQDNNHPEQNQQEGHIQEMLPLNVVDH